MDIEQLSKSQILLLVLLVSFVTSIATGIVTVSLMDQAPPAIAQTVNRIIERTVEKVVPGQTAATVVTQEKTVVVKEADLVAQAVEKIAPSVVRLYTREAEEPQFLGLAIVLDSSGRLVTDTEALGEQADAEVALQDGTRVRAFVKARSEANGLAYLQAATTTIVDGKAKAISWVPALVTPDQPVLGESIVTISGRSVMRIDDGIVTAVLPKTASENVIDTNISTDSFVKGSPIINSSGSIIGVSTVVSRASSPTGFLSAAALVPKPAGEKSPTKK